MKLGIELYLPTRKRSEDHDYTTASLCLNLLICYASFHIEYVRRSSFRGTARMPQLNLNVYYGLGPEVAERSWRHRFAHFSLYN